MPNELIVLSLQCVQSVPSVRRAAERMAGRLRLLSPGSRLQPMTATAGLPVCDFVERAEAIPSGGSGAMGRKHPPGRVDTRWGLGAA